MRHPAAWPEQLAAHLDLRVYVVNGAMTGESFMLFRRLPPPVETNPLPAGKFNRLPPDQSLTHMDVLSRADASTC